MTTENLSECTIKIIGNCEVPTSRFEKMVTSSFPCLKNVDDLLAREAERQIDPTDFDTLDIYAYLQADPEFFKYAARDQVDLLVERMADLVVRSAQNYFVSFVIGEEESRKLHRGIRYNAHWFDLRMTLLKLESAANEDRNDPLR